MLFAGLSRKREEVHRPESAIKIIDEESDKKGVKEVL
jgi:hypothetical protein